MASTLPRHPLEHRSRSSSALPWLVAAALTAGLGCGPAATRLPAESLASGPGTGSGGRLYQRGSELFVVGANLGTRRAGFLYVLEAQPSIPGSRTHLAIGVVRGVEGQGDTLVVRWACRLADGQVIPASGLPVEELHPNSTLYRGACWGRYLPASGPLPDSGPLDLFLDRGSDDGVAPDTRYQVLRVDSADPTREVAGQNFHRLGVCRILLDGLQEQRSRCRLERVLAPEFNQAAWMSGGFVHQIQAEGAQP